MEQKNGLDLLYYFEPHNTFKIDTHINILNLIQEVSGSMTNQHVYLVDRTGLFKGKYRTKNEFPFAYKSCVETYEEILHSRAQAILKQADKITVSWSGGIDSTVALIALMKNASSLDRIKIAFELRSLKENPVLFKMIKNKIRYELVDGHMSRYKIDEDELFVVGEPEKMWMRTDDLETSLFESLPWKKSIEIQFENHFLLKHSHIRDFLFQRLEEHIKYSPIPIKSYDQLKWWIRISLKYDNGLKRYWKFFKKGNDQIKRRIGFFSDDRFVNWAITNRNKEDVSQRKEPMKKFIYDFDRNEDYYHNKKNEDSAWYINSLDEGFRKHRYDIRSLIAHDEIVLFVDENYKEYTLKDKAKKMFINTHNDREWVVINKDWYDGKL